MLRFPLHRKQGPCPAALAPRPRLAHRQAFPSLEEEAQCFTTALVLLPESSFGPSRFSLQYESRKSDVSLQPSEPSSEGARGGQCSFPAPPSQAVLTLLPISHRVLLEFLQAEARPSSVPQAGLLRNYRASLKAKP